MGRQQIGETAIAFVDTAAQRIDDEQMRRAARRFVERHRRVANFFESVRQAERIARELHGAGVGQIFALARHRQRHQARDQRRQRDEYQRWEGEP